MSPEMVITIIQRAFEVMILIGGPMLLAGLVVGLIISVFQAATQINEATLSFIPKLLITFMVAVLAGPWMLSILMDYTIRLYQAIPTMIG
ncbi:flagellar biosynthesis protein FliQ [Chitinimonas viridis]|uniref:Flagellar biosynthetic protein FliQ n=2 Tax=Chitinimonas TaxID=240411 RepID=A0ABT8B2J1_9NEIS|nr:MULTISPECIES: flagellar biosynthesis protein FliQ [Chitinimonas]MDN3576240.1 flagellar biosynthesis protein FliQ [Chitinimonas viridis]GLR14533.1 flagellar export apparatus protein FliQ [Chitinimonas prasina]